MFCDCKCNPRTIINIPDLPTVPDISIVNIGTQTLVGVIDMLPRVNKDFFSDYEAIERTYEVDEYKKKSHHEKFKRNLPRLRNDFRSYHLNPNRFNREEYYHEKYSTTFFDKDEKNVSKRLVTNEIDNPLIYPIEFTINTSHREGGLIQVIDVFDKLTRSSSFVEKGITGNITTYGVNARKESNISIATKDSLKDKNPFCDQSVTEDLSRETVSLTREVYDGNLDVDRTVSVIKIDNMVTYFEEEENNISPFKEEKKEKFYEVSYNKKDIAYESAGFDNDYSKFLVSQSLSFQGWID
jgi:hypothetical protein